MCANGRAIVAAKGLVSSERGKSAGTRAKNEGVSARQKVVNSMLMMVMMPAKPVELEYTPNVIYAPNHVY